METAVANCAARWWCWFEQARRSAIYLSRVPYEPSAGVQLLAALQAMFTKNRREITSEQVVRSFSRSRLAVALISQPRSNHQKPGRGLLKDFEIRPVAFIRPSEQISRGTVTGRRNSRTRLRVCYHPSRTSDTQAWGRRKDVKVFGCSDDCARCGTAKVDRMPTNG